MMDARTTSKSAKKSSVTGGATFGLPAPVFSDIVQHALDFTLCCGRGVQVPERALTATDAPRSASAAPTARLFAVRTRAQLRSMLSVHYASIDPGELIVFGDVLVLIPNTGVKSLASVAFGVLVAPLDWEQV